MTASSPRPAAPDATGGELRARAEAICVDMPGVDFDDNGESWERKVDYVAAVLRDLLAERDTLAAQVRAVEGLTYASDDGSEYEHRYYVGDAPVCEGADDCPACFAADIRRALGTPTTGGGEIEAARRARFNPSDPEDLGFGPGDYT